MNHSIRYSITASQVHFTMRFVALVVLLFVIATGNFFMIDDSQEELESRQASQVTSVTISKR